MHLKSTKELHCCVSVATLSIFFTLLLETDAPQEYKGAALLRLRGNAFYIFYAVARDICTSTVQRTALLLFFGNNAYVKAPQYYIIHTLPFFLWFMPTCLALQSYKSSELFCLSQHFQVTTADLN